MFNLCTYATMTKKFDPLEIKHLVYSVASHILWPLSMYSQGPGNSEKLNLKN